MIHSILDTDLYKLSMQQAVCKLYPKAKVRYKFIDRGATYFPEKMVEELRVAVKDMASLYLTLSEQNFLKDKLYFFDPVYRDFLNGYTYDPDEVNIEWDDGELKMDIEGYWYRTILWEVPLMALVSELYFKHTNMAFPIVWSDFDQLNKDKAQDFYDLRVKVADFGTRRRYSYKSQQRLVEEFSTWDTGGQTFDFFTGTSNVHFAEKYNLTPIGTQAHEWFMFHAAKYGFHQANSIALGRWVDVYNGSLGIALTDTFTTQNFFESFDTLYAKLFDGLRHDSGDPIKFGEQSIQHYENLGISPQDKTIVFSDGLNFEKVKEIHSRFQGRTRLSYGIGTWLTNDFPGVKPLNMVIKMSEAKPQGRDWISTIKLSDDKGKHTGNKKMINLAKQVLEY